MMQSVLLEAIHPQQVVVRQRRGRWAMEAASVQVVSPKVLDPALGASSRVAQVTDVEETVAPGLEVTHRIQAVVHQALRHRRVHRASKRSCPSFSAKRGCGTFSKWLSQTLCSP